MRKEQFKQKSEIVYFNKTKIQTIKKKKMKKNKQHLILSLTNKWKQEKKTNKKINVGNYKKLTKIITVMQKKSKRKFRWKRMCVCVCVEKPCVYLNGYQEN